MADIIITKSLSVTDDAVVINCEDNPMVTVDPSGTWTGTLNIERSTDPANPQWTAAQVFTVAQVAAASTITSNVVRLVSAIGVGQVRVRFNPASSGVAVVTLRAGDGTISGGGSSSGGAVAGDVASGTTDSGNPVKIGRKAVDLGVNPSPVAAGARTDSYATRGGLDLILPGHPNTITFAQKFTTAQTDQALVSVSAGTKIVCTGFLVTANSTNTIQVAAVLGFGVASVPASGNAGIIGAHGGIAAGSGFGEGAGGSIVGIGADAEDIRLTSGVPTGGDIWVTLKYFTTPA